MPFFIMMLNEMTIQLLVFGLCMKDIIIRNVSDTILSQYSLAGCACGSPRSSSRHHHHIISVVVSANDILTLRLIIRRLIISSSSKR